MKPLPIYIGYDTNERVAFHACVQSILDHSSYPVTIHPLVRTSLERQNLYWRPRHSTESTDFSLTRFLVPNLMGYNGLAVFMDCDFLVRGDIAEIAVHVAMDPGRAVYVVQHDYTPKTTTKFLGFPQKAYPRKNWTSFMVFDAAQCKALTPAYVNTAHPGELHQFKWLEDHRIGKLPPEWNHLVGEYEPNPNAKAIHFTLGGPYFEEYKDCEFSEEWFTAFHRANYAKEGSVTVGRTDEVRRKIIEFAAGAINRHHSER